MSINLKNVSNIPQRFGSKRLELTDLQVGNVTHITFRLKFMFRMGPPNKTEYMAQYTQSAMARQINRCLEYISSVGIVDCEGIQFITKIHSHHDT